jgi:electron transfer flavoprotein beta subunit
MEIIVCIKQVPGTAKVEIDEKTGVLKRDGVDSKMNPFDLYAIETAVHIKEQKNGTVTVVSMGPPQAVEIIKEAYMLGADRGILLSDRKFAGADVLATAYTLSQGIRKAENWDLIICGKQTTDGDTAQVGAEIAEFLGIPNVSNVRKLVTIGDDSITVEMDMDDMAEIVEVSYPCLLSVEKNIFQPALPSFKKKLATKNRRIEEYGLKDFMDQDERRYGLNGSPTHVNRIFPPEVNGVREIWSESAEETTDRLYSKLKQLKFIQQED